MAMSNAALKLAFAEALLQSMNQLSVIDFALS